MITFFYTLFIGIFCVMVQMFVPDIAFLGGARPFLPVLAVIYAGIMLRDLRVFIIALTTGFYHDLMCPGRLGVTAIALCVVAALILTQTQGRLLRRPDFQILVVLVGSFLFLGLSYFFYLMQIWSGNSSPGDWVLITYGSIMNAILGPILFALFNLPLKLAGWSTGRREEYTGYAAQ